MAELFTPETDGVSFEKPVADHSTSNLVSGLAGLFAPRQVKPASEGDRKRSLQRALVRDIRAAKGDARKESMVLTNYGFHGGDLDAPTKELLTRETGKSFDLIGRTDEDIARMAAEEAVLKQMETPAFQTKLIGTYKTHPDVTMEERQKIALSSMAQQASLDEEFERAGRDFTPVLRAKIAEGLQSELNSWEGALILKEQNGEQITAEDLNIAQTSLNTWKATLFSKPSWVNASDEKKKPILNQIAAVEETLNYIQSETTGESLAAKYASRAMSIMQTRFLEDGVIDEKESANLALMGNAKNWMGDPQVFGTMLEMLDKNIKGSGKELVDVHKQSGVIRFYTTESTPQSTDQDTSVLTEKEKENAWEATHDNAFIFKNLDKTSFNESPMQRDAALVAVQRQAEGLTRMDGFLTFNGVSTLFNDRWVDNVKEVWKNEGPEVEEQQSRTFQKGLSQLYVATNEHLNSLTKASPVRVQEDGKLAVNLEYLREQGPERVGDFEFVLNEFYGGSLEAFMRGSDSDFVHEVDSSVSKHAKDIKALAEATIDKQRDAISSLTYIDNLKTKLSPPDLETPQERTYEVPEELLQDTKFISAVEDTSRNIGINPDWLLRAMEFETAGTFSASIKAPTSSATGLIQFIEGTAKNLGTSTEELAGMSRVEQMAYVEKYLKPYANKIKNFGDLYMAIHWPKGVGKPNSYVMYTEGSKAYDANKGLDVNGDGTVTRGEAIARAEGSTGYGKMRSTGTPVKVTDDLLPETDQSISTSPVQPTLQVDSGVGPLRAPDGTDGIIKTDDGTPVQPKTPEVDKTPRKEASATTKALLKRFGQTEDDVPQFNTEVEFKSAIKRGELKDGDLVVVDGELKVVDQ